MTYINYLQLKQEPFASSADPSFLYSSQHIASILGALEIAILLRRGVGVCLGGPGMGKTMLCRCLISNLRGNASVDVLPLFRALSGNVLEFLPALHACVEGRPSLSSKMSGQQAGAELADAPQGSAQGWLEAIKTALRKRAGGRDGNNIVLCIDEGQRMSVECLEALRELLNLENEAGKLLQIIIFAHPGFEQTLNQNPAFADRVSERHSLAALTRTETRELVEHRLHRAGVDHRLFSTAALNMIHAASQGIPRRIIHLAHKALLTLVAQNRSRVTYFLARSCALEQGWRPRRFSPVGLGVILLLSLLTLGAAVGLEPVLQRFVPGTAMHVPLVRTTVLRSPVVSRRQEARQAPEQQALEQQALEQQEPEQQELEQYAVLDDAEPQEQSGGMEGSGEHVRDEQPAASEQEPDEQEQRDVRYLVQVGAFANFAKADELYEAFERDFAGAGMLGVEYKGLTVHVVYLAQFSTAHEAFQMLRDVNREYGIDAFVIEMLNSGYYPLYAEPVRGE